MDFQLKVGDTGAAICESCKTIVATTYKLRDVPLTGYEEGDPRNGMIVPGILVGVCDSCSEVVAIPAQTTSDIKNFIDSIKNVHPSP